MQKIIEKVVKSPFPPERNNVVWIDTSNRRMPLIKVWSKQRWRLIGGMDGFPFDEFIIDCGTSIPEEYYDE